MTNKDFLEILNKYLAGTASEEEEQFLFDVYRRMEDRYEWKDDEMQSLNLLETRLIERFRNSITAEAEQKSLPRRTIWKRFTAYSKYHAAAILLFLFSIGIAYYFYQSPAQKVSRLFVDNKINDVIVHYNESNLKEKIIFSDQSYVELQPGSKIVYDRIFSSDYRQVYLDGTGFFQIKKDSQKPFVVYTDKIVTKVLGTSFTVQSGTDKENATVIVKTGKVSVFRTADFTIKNARPNLQDGEIVMPNHAVGLNDSQQFERALAISPQLVNTSDPVGFDFDNTPVDSVFDRLQKAYGIVIVYDKVKFVSCAINVNLGKEDFYQKLELICRTINASYEVRQGKVFVQGAGCGE